MIDVVCSEELGRPENKDLKSFIDKLAGVKQIIDDKGKTAGESSYLSALRCFYAVITHIAFALPMRAKLL